MRVTMHQQTSLKLLLLLLLSLALSVHGGEIIKGEKVPEGEMLFMASVQNVHQHHVCGGFLISEDFVLTAAHCDNNSVVHSVVLGTHDLETGAGIRYTLKKKCKHESFEKQTYANDIMLLKLHPPVKLGKKRVEIINLPKTEVKLRDCDTCQVAGWGITCQGGLATDDLQKVNVSFINLDECRKAWDDLPDTVLCAGGFTPDGKGTCQGDSGGPLVCNGKAVGIVSFNNGNCSYPNYPNVYTNLSKYIDWIEKTKKKEKC